MKSSGKKKRRRENKMMEDEKKKMTEIKLMMRTEGKPHCYLAAKIGDSNFCSSHMTRGISLIT